MFGLSSRASALWIAAVAITAGITGVCLLAAAGDVSWAPAAILFAIAGCIAERFRVDLPTSRGGNRVTMTIGAAATIAALLAFPLQWAVLTVSASMLIASQTVWFKRVYNGSQIAIAASAAGALWQLRGNTDLTEVSSVPWIIIVVAVYFGANQLLTSGIISAASGLPMRLVLFRANRHTWPANLGIMFVGVLIAILWSISPWTIALAAIPLTGLYYTLRNTVSLETNTVEALFQLADILDARDAYTHGHSLRVGQYAEKLALKLGLSGDDAHMVFLAGRLHDIGKCAIKNEVLLKPGALDDEERAHMCIHPVVGGSMLESFSLFRECARYVRGHHERWDGQGYPDKLSGDAIPLGARIIAVADAYDAMTTTRPYRKALPASEAYRRLSEGAGTQWDPRAITAFLEILDATPRAHAETETEITAAEPVPAEPVQAGRAHAEPVQSARTHAETGQSAPAHAEPGQSAPAYAEQSAPAQVEPVQLPGGVARDLDRAA